ncbi:MAG: hemolysin III family protein, partial [Pseudomonadota bacterium]
ADSLRAAMFCSKCVDATLFDDDETANCMTVTARALEISRRAAGSGRVPTPAERRVDAWVHVLAITLTVPAILAMLWPTIWAGAPLQTLAAGIYGVGLLTMFVASFAYHHVVSPAQKDLFRSIDHAAIFLMIAGTYTPFALISLGGVVGHGLLLIVWVLALFGAWQRLRRPRDSVTAPVWPYLALGWISLPLLGVIISQLPPTALTYLILGGAIYTVGVIFHRWESLLYQNAIWHAFVLAAAACHYVSIRDVLSAASA